MACSFDNMCTVEWRWWYKLFKV